MLMPSIFGETFMDDFFNFPERLYGRAVNANANGLMKTDIADSGDGYKVTIDLPGFQKENVKGELKDGYLVITASTDQKKEKEGENGRYIRRERYTGTCSRSFYVGEDVTQEDIKAKFENGTLRLDIPKKEARPKVEEAVQIAIEG